MELSRNWHWMWSTFYYNKKHYGFINALIKVSGKFFSSLIKMIFLQLIFKKKKEKFIFSVSQDYLIQLLEKNHGTDQK